MNILITGSTGFLGSALLPHLIQDISIKKIFLLIRPSRKESPAKRLENLIAKNFRPEDHELSLRKFEIISGDLTSPRLGLSDHAYEQLAGTVQQILHIGASTDFGAPLAESRLINVEGTRTILDFALRSRKLGSLQRLDYVSTAFVAGTKPGVIRESDLARNQEFANAYEQSKFEAEQLVREYMPHIPLAIYRPSIVVGDSRTGFTPHFKVLYWPLILLSKNILPFIPCRRSARLDIVPIDFVADSMYRLLKSEKSVSRTIYLSAGPDKAIRIDHFLKDAFHTANIKRRPMIPVWLFKLVKNSPLRGLLSNEFWQTAELAAVYNAYLTGTNTVFQNTESEQLIMELGGTKAPTWQRFGQTILTFCVESKWGKRLPYPEWHYRNP